MKKKLIAVIVTVTAAVAGGMFWHRTKRKDV